LKSKWAEGGQNAGTENTNEQLFTYDMFPLWLSRAWIGRFGKYWWYNQIKLAYGINYCQSQKSYWQTLPTRRRFHVIGKWWRNWAGQGFSSYYLPSPVPIRR